MKKINISRLFDNKTFCKIFSIIGAIIIWASITLTVKTDFESTLRDVPINFSVAGTSVEALGLSAFNKSDSMVDIRMSGTRANLNSISKEDFDVTMSLGGVTSSGRYTVKIDVKLNDESPKITVVDFSPKEIEVNFDRTASKTLPILADISGLSVKEGYLLDKGYPSAQDVSIIGPESVVKTIDSCVANVKLENKTLTQTTSLSDVPIVLYDENKKEIVDDSITIDKDSVDVSIPVLKIKTLPIKVHTINTPSTFADKQLNYSISETTLTIAGPEESVDAMTQIDVKYADMKTIRPGNSVTLPIEIPSGFVNVNNVSNISITIPAENMTEKNFTVKEFKLLGVLENKNVQIVTKQLNNVKLIGDKEFISGLSESEIIAEINVASSTVTNGTTTVAATISVPGKTGVFWAYGNYEVIVRYK